MFYRGYSVIASLARPEALPSPRVQGAVREDAVRRAMQRDIQDMPLSARLGDPAAYLGVQRARRQCLEALLTAEPDEAALWRMIDLVGMIVEESQWSENPARAPFDDDNHPEIDFQCAETLMLLAWTSRALGDRLTSRVSGKLLYEARRRVFSPFLAHEDYRFMRGRGRRPLSILSDILLSAVLLETSDQRRNAILKQALRMLDAAVDVRSRRSEALEDAAADTGAVTDLAALLRKLTRGQLDLTPDCPTPDWLDQLLYPWLEGLYFCDPAGNDTQPAISGAELFRIGLAANDDALTALGAHLHRTRPVPSATLTGRLQDQSCRAMLEADDRKPPRIKCAATPHNRVMVSRFSGMTCCMHAGGRANAGGLMLFCMGEPVLTEDRGVFNLPLIGGREQTDAPESECVAEYDLKPDRDTMTIDLTHAWMPGMLRSYQRTALIQRPDAVLRLVDAFDLESPAVIAFRFHTPLKPEMISGGLRLGRLDFSWEGDLNMRFDPLDNGLTRIELTTPAPVRRGFYTFNFARI